MKNVIIANGTQTIALTGNTKAEQFLNAKAEGFTGGKTSFYEMLNGNVASVKGWAISNEVIAVELTEIAGMRQRKNRMSFTGATGRLTITPATNGLFRVRLTVKAGLDANEINDALNGKVHNNVIRLVGLTAEQVADLTEIA